MIILFLQLTVQGVEGADVILTGQWFCTFDSGVAEDAGFILEALVALPDGAAGAVRLRGIR